MFPAFHVVQHQHGAGARRQGGHGPFQVAAQQGLARGVGRGRSGQRLFVTIQAGPAALGAQLHQGGVHRQPMQPGGHRALEAEAGQGLPGAHERLLGQILRPRAGLAHQPHDDPMHTPVVAAVQLLERLHVRPRGAAREGDVFAGVERGGVGFHGGRQGLHQHGDCDAAGAPGV